MVKAAAGYSEKNKKRFFEKLVKVRKKFKKVVKKKKKLRKVKKKT